MTNVIKMKMLSADKSLWPLRWHQLAVMLDAGLSIEKAMNALDKNANDPEIKRIIRYIKSGTSFSSALIKIKTINDFDKELLNCAEQAGCLSQGLAHIAELKINQQQNIKTLRASLLLPKAVLMIGMFAAIFIRVASYGEGVFEAVTGVGLITVVTLMIINLFVKLLSIDIKLVISIAWPYAVLRTKYTQLKLEFEQLFYRSLVWQLSSGVDIATSLERNRLLLKSAKYRSSVIEAQQQCVTGVNLPLALMENGLVLTKRMKQVLNTADNTGNFEQAVGHELDIISEKLRQQATARLKWWPRVVYVFVMVVIMRVMV